MLIVAQRLNLHSHGILGHQYTLKLIGFSF